MSVRRGFVLGGALMAIGATALAGCEDKRFPSRSQSTESNTPPPITSATSAETEALGIDAGAFGEALDPPAPAGDLKAEIERFVNLDTCVSERAKLDPLVGDAL